MNSSVLNRQKARIAAFRYRNPARSFRVIAVAGEYGKTTTALLLSELLQEAGQSVFVLTNQGCYHNDTRLSIGYDSSSQAFQRALANARRKHASTLIVEVTDLLAETQALSTIPIEMSVITSMSSSANILLNQHTNYSVIPSGFDTAEVSVAPHQAISFGEDETAEARIKSVRLYRKGTEVEVVIDHQTSLTLSTYLLGKANAFNIAAAVAAAYILPVDTNVFEEGIARLENVPGNYVNVPVSSVYSVVVDAATEQKSVELVLESASKLKKRRLIIVLDETVSEAAFEIAKKTSDRLIVVGKAGDGVAGITFEPSANEAANVALRGAKKDDTVLFMGCDYARADEAGITELQHMIEANDERE